MGQILTTRGKGKKSQKSLRTSFMDDPRGGRMGPNVQRCAADKHRWAIGKQCACAWVLPECTDSLWVGNLFRFSYTRASNSTNVDLLLTCDVECGVGAPGDAERVGGDAPVHARVLDHGAQQEQGPVRQQHPGLKRKYVIGRMSLKFVTNSKTEEEYKEN